MKIQFRGADLFYSDQGKGGVLIFLHGFLENKEIWEEVVGVFSAHYRCLSIDLPGHGQSASLGYVHTMELMADAVEELIKQLRLKKVTLIGHSMGGYVALALAERNPDSLRGLVLVNSTPLADSPERKLNRDRAIAALKVNHHNFIRMAVANLFRPKNRRIFAKEIQELKRRALKTTVQGAVAALEGMKIRPDREVLMHFSPYPKMLMLGKKDPVIPMEPLIERLADTSVQIVEFPDGHMSFIENKEQFIEKMLEFLKNVHHN